MTEAAVELTAVSRRFGEVEAISALSWEIPRRRIVGLAGPDGAGKTTLLRMIAGLLPSTEGQLQVFGRWPAGAAEIGYMPGAAAVYEDLSTEENLSLYGGLAGLKRAECAARAESFLERAQLLGARDRRAGRLSGGMRQKLALGCALMAAPPLLLLDEPGVGVDPKSRRQLWALVKERVQAGATVVWATAYLDEAEACDEVLLLDGGRAVYAGPPSALSARIEGRSFALRPPAGDSSRALLRRLRGDPRVLDGALQGDGVRVVCAAGTPATELAEIAAPEGVKAGLRPVEARPVAPRFEDAYIDLLGGAPPYESPLSQLVPALPPAPAGEAPPSVIRCEGLTKRFGAFTATCDVSFEVKAGEVFGLLGPNGAGKTTLFKMLCGLSSISAGRAEVVGARMDRAPREAKLQIGYMAQKFSLYDLLSVGQNLELFAGMYGLAGRERRARVGALVEAFHLQAYLTESPAGLPLGFKQRLALACALIHQPRILFLDEPTSGVDPITRREFWSHINGLSDRGMTVLVTTHFMDEAEYCDRIGLMHASRLIALDRPDGLKAAVRREGEAEPSMEESFLRLIEEAEAAHA